jgi:hypothetical protein
MRVCVCVGCGVWGVRQLLHSCKHKSKTFHCFRFDTGSHMSKMHTYFEQAHGSLVAEDLPT